MQRVLSFQTARGFGETSEFVTKRMCFSFLFSIGFLCLLCGFVVGRFAAETAVDIRAEKERLELIGNGLENFEHLKEMLIEKLKGKDYNSQYQSLNFSIENIKKSLSELEFFNKIQSDGECFIGTLQGKREPDKYVVLQTEKPPANFIAVEIIKELKELYHEFDWTPRRSLIFILCKDTPKNYLPSGNYNFLSTHQRSNIVAFISLKGSISHENDYIAISGSDIIKSTVMETLKKFKTDEYQSQNKYFHRLNLDKPHARIQFLAPTSNARTMRDKKMNSLQSIIAQVSATSIWKLSQMTLFEWYPQSLHESFYQVFSDMNSSISPKLKELIEDKVRIITNFGNTLTEKIAAVVPSKPLDVRMMNDLIKNFEIALLCPDENSKSQTDVAEIYELHSNQQSIETYLNSTLNCFNMVIKNFEDMT